MEEWIDEAKEAFKECKGKCALYDLCVMEFDTPQYWKCHPRENQEITEEDI